MEGRVLRVAGGTYHVEIGDAVVDCVLAGRLKQGGSGRVAVGDRIRVERPDDDRGRITEILARRSKLARRKPEGDREQIIAANIDQMAAVFSVRRPEPDLQMLDRMLVLADLNDVDAFVVVNKTDLAEGDSDVPRPFRIYREAEYEVLPTSATEGRGLDALRSRLAGRMTVLAGPSGAGKSSLLNRMVPDLDRRVGEVSERAGRGRHTTVNATLIPLPDDGYVADTPGLQYLPVWALEPDDLAAAFPEFRPWLEGCRFNDCRHVEEPGCGIRTALERGDIAESRYESYRGLLSEAEEQKRPWA